MLFLYTNQTKTPLTDWQLATLSTCQSQISVTNVNSNSVAVKFEIDIYVTRQILGTIFCGSREFDNSML